MCDLAGVIAACRYGDATDADIQQLYLPDEIADIPTGWHSGMYFFVNARVSTLWLSAFRALFCNTVLPVVQA